MRKVLTFLMISVVAVSTALAIPAKRTPVTITQSDGTKVIVTMRGDEWHHSFVTSDGKPVSLEADGNLYYRTASGVSAVMAHEVSDRSAAETSFINSNASEMTFSAIASKSSRAKAGKAYAARRKVGSTQVPTTGSPRVPIILVQYSDKKMSNTKATFVSQYTSGSTSAYQYFSDQSNGKYTPQFDVYGIYTLSKTRATYGGNDSNGDDKGVGLMVYDAIAAAGSDIDWSQYDNDGDGEADVCIVVYAGVGEAQATSVTNAVWPCQWSLSDASRYESGVNTVTRNSTKIDRFAVFNEVNGSSDSSTKIDGVGTFCHEFSHCLGLPDFYETTYENGYYGIGSWSLMDYGSYNNDGYTPIGYSGYEKNFMGWVDLVTPVQGTQYTLPVWNQKSENTDVAVKVTSPLNSNEYYVLENRAQQGWDAYIPDEGMMVTHVTYVASRWSANSVNDEAIQLFTIIPADGKADENNETKDLYGETNHALTDETSPAATLNMLSSGSLASSTGGAGNMGQPLTEININSDKSVSFWYMKGAEPHFAPVLNEASAVGKTQFTASWTDETEAEYVTSYDLQVNAKSSAAEATLVAEEDMSAGTTTWTKSTSGTYKDSDGLRLGTSKATGSVTSPSVDLSSGTATVVVNAKYFGTDTSAELKVTVLDASGNELASATQGSLASSYADYTVTLTSTFDSSCKVKLENSVTGKRVILSNVKIYNGAYSAADARRRATETGDAKKRTITGITDKSYTVADLNEGETYTFKVRTNYSDGTTSAWTATKSVTLQGEKQLNPYIVATEELALGSVTVGESATGNIEILAEELKGDVTLTLNDPNGVFALASTTVAQANAEAGANVAVTFTPAAAQAYSATVTVSSTDAESVTVALSGSGAIVKEQPELIAAAESEIGSTSFTASWNAVANVKSYTLEVNQTAAPATATELLTKDFSENTSGWTTGGSTTQESGYIRLGSNSKTGYITSPTVDLTDYNGVVTVEVVAKYFGSDSGTTLRISCGSASKDVTLTSSDATYTVVLNGTAGETTVKLASITTKKRPMIASVKIYGGDASESASAAAKAVAETGDATQRVITGIETSKYTVKDLVAGGTFEYKVKAVYTDDTESDYSASRTVTLNESGEPQPALEVEPGDITFDQVYTGAEEIQTFVVTATNLTEDVTVSLQTSDDVDEKPFSVSPESIALADLENGEVEVTVKFAPQNAGEYSAVIALNSAGLATVNVPVSGVATLEKLVPELEAEATGITSTSFTATWTEVPNAESYTLLVTGKVESTEPLLSEDWSEDNTTWSENWSGTAYTDVAGYVRLGARKSETSITTNDAVDLSASNGKVTVTFVAKAYSNDTGVAVKVTVIDEDDNEQSETVSITSEDATYSVVIDATAGNNYIRFSNVGTSQKRAMLKSVAIYAGEVASASAAAKAVVEDGDANRREITGITGNTYTVKDLAENGTFTYKVKAVYTDGDESDWCEVKEVTLGGLLGDVNMDGLVDVADVVALANHVMGETPDPFNINVANINSDEIIDVSDVVALANLIMGSGE